MAVQVLWRRANLADRDKLSRESWLHPRLLEIQAPSQFALSCVNDALAEQIRVTGDFSLQSQLLELFLLGVQQGDGPEDGLASVSQLREIYDAELQRTAFGRRRPSFSAGAVLTALSREWTKLSGGSSTLETPRPEAKESAQ